MRIKNAYYRIRQFCFSTFMYVAPFRRVKVIKGAGSVYKVPDIIKTEGLERIMIVTTPGFIRRGSLQDLFERFKTKNIHITIFSKVMPDPTTDCVEEAVALYKSEQCQAIVAIGGGSVIDCSKAVGARIARPKKSLLQMNGLLKVMKKIPNIYAIPTTAGTGSEVTAGAVITDSNNHYKYTIMDLCLVPHYAILDPKLTCELPAATTAVTGMDALTHAVEAYTNRFCSPKARKAALKAVKLIYENLLPAYENGKNIEAREKMLLASYYAGIAINNNFAGYVHAIAHGIGGLYGVPHGQANAIIMPYVLENFGDSIVKKLSVLADITGLKGTDEKEKAQAFIESICELNRKLNIPKRVEELKEKDYVVLVERAIKEGNPTYPVPVIWEREDIEKILKNLKE